MPFGIATFKNNKIFFKITFLVYFISLAIVATNITLRHKQPTAIAKLKNYLTSYKEPITIITNPLINYYLASTGVKTEFISVNMPINLNNKNSSEKILMIGDYHNLINQDINIKKDTTFHHNPYVNRMWSTINVYKIEKYNE